MMKQKVRVAIIGSTGYGGVELMRLLKNHPYVEITSVISSSTAGAPVTEGYPHLQHIMEQNLDDVNIAQIKEQSDVVFAATPSGVSTTLVPQLIEAGCKVIDLSGDFRVSASDYKQWYGLE